MFVEDIKKLTEAVNDPFKKFYKCTANTAQVKL